MGAKEFDEKRQRNASGDSTVSSDSMTNYIPTPPDGGWGWVVVLASFINHIIVDGITFTFGVFYLEFLDFFKESKGKTALVGSLLAGFYLMAGKSFPVMENKVFVSDKMDLLFYGFSWHVIKRMRKDFNTNLKCDICSTFNTSLITHSLAGTNGSIGEGMDIWVKNE